VEIKYSLRFILCFTCAIFIISLSLISVSSNTRKIFQKSAGTSKISNAVSPTITTDTISWKAYSSSLGYSLKYPSYMVHEEHKTYPFDLLIRDKDLEISFNPQNVSSDKKAEDLVIWQCGGAADKIQIDRIDDVRLYKLQVVTKNGLYCSSVIADLTRPYLIPSLPAFRWYLEIKATAKNASSVRLFNRILSTLHFSS